MKFFKALVILLILVLNQTATTYELSKRHGMKFIAMSLKKKSTSTMSKGKSRFSFSRRSNKIKIKSNLSKLSSVSVKARTREAGLILAGVQAGLKVSNIAVTKIKNKVYSKVLDVAKAEYDANQDFIESVQEQEILNCETIKLMIETNKYFFFQAELKNVFIKSMIQSKQLEGEAKTNKSEIKSINDEIQSLTFFKTILEEVGVSSSHVSSLIEVIEDRVCNQSEYYQAFNERNEKLDELMTKIKEKIENSPKETAGTIFSSASDIFSNWYASNEDLTKFEWNKEASLEPDTFDSSFSRVLGIASYAAQSVDNINEIKEIYSKIQEAKKKGELIVGWLSIVSQGLSLIANITQIFKAMTSDNPIVGIIANVVAAAAKLLEAIVLIYKFAVKKTFVSLYRMLGGILNFVNSLVTIAITPFSGIISEAISLISNLFDLYNVRSKLKEQQGESNYYQILRLSRSRERENMMNYNICVVNYVSSQSIFDIIIKMHEFDAKFNKNRITRNTINTQEITTQILSSIITHGTNNQVQFNIKEEIKIFAKSIIIYV
jgi:hypothetical protein